MKKNHSLQIKICPKEKKIDLSKIKNKQKQIVKR